MDPWYSLGNADMLEVAHMAVHVGQMTSIDAMKQAFDAITVNSARAMGLSEYGIKKGLPANCVVLPARDPVEAIRLKANRLAVIRNGGVIAETEPKATKLSLPGRPDSLDAADYAPVEGTLPTR